MTRSTMIHYVTGITDWTYYPSNANAVNFTVTDSKGGRDNIALFFDNNPQEAKDFYERNTSGNSSTIKDKKRINDLEKALERIAYGNIRLIDIGSVAKDALEVDPGYGPIPF